MSVSITTIFGAVGVDVASSKIPQSGTMTYYAYALLGIIVVPVVEETFYRNIIQKRLQETLGVTTAILLASVLFGFPHTFNFIDSSTLTFLGTIAIVIIQGGILGYAFYRTKNTTVSVLGHLSHNAVVIILAGLGFGF